MKKREMKSDHNTPADAKKDPPDSAKTSNQVIKIEDQGNYLSIEEEDELVSLLHLSSRSGLDELMIENSLDYKSLLDYVYRDIIPEEANTFSDSDEIETEQERT